MAYSLSFSALNESMRPRIPTSEKVYSSLNRLEYRLTGSLRSYPTYYRPTVLPTQPKPQVLEAAGEPEEPEEPREDEEQQEDLVLDSPENDSCLTEESLKDECGEEDGGLSLSEEKDIPGELTSAGTDAPSQSVANEGGSSLQRSYIDGTLPDLIRSGRPLGRRRTLGHVSDTLKEVRREVELSRRRSIKLKAQVDKLQESREGQGWSQHRERVTDDILSILRLLSPLTEPESTLPQPPHHENQLDVALAQLQNVARKLAMSHSTQQLRPGRGAEDNAILQQALYDRDEAIEKKKAMEAELLRSKTEMMCLNNQLLEAVQKRLELSLELEAWKEDVQLILHQQVQSQQQAEQSPKKSSRMGLLRRNNKPLMQKPSHIPSSQPVPPTTVSSQIFVSGSSVSAASTAASPPPPPPGTQRNWRDKLRRGRGVRSGDQDAMGPSESDNGFQVISLD